MKTVSLELAKELQAKGIEIETSFYWSEADRAVPDWHISEFKGLGKCIPAPTTDELLEWLPWDFKESMPSISHANELEYWAYYEDGNGVIHQESANNPAAALAKLALWVKKENSDEL